jgi:hypothetical protein
VRTQYEDVYRKEWNVVELSRVRQEIARELRARCGEGEKVAGPERLFRFNFNVSLERRSYEEHLRRNGSVLLRTPMVSSSPQHRLFDVHSYAVNVCNITALHAEVAAMPEPTAESWSMRSGRFTNIKAQLIVAMDAEWVQRQVH